MKEHDISDIEAQIQKVGCVSKVEWIDENAIVLFMKGTPKLPRCGFSNYVLGVLKFYGKIGRRVEVWITKV